MAKKSNKKKAAATVSATHPASSLGGMAEDVNGAIQPRENGSAPLQPPARDTPAGGMEARGASPAGRVAAGVAQEPGLAKAWTPGDPRYWQLVMGLLVIGIALRQFNLGWFPFSHDESIHAWYAENFQDYKFDPVYHGPLLYHLIAMCFALFGKNDFAARLAPSLLGIGALLIVLGPGRRWLGSRGALWSLGLLTISPVMVTYQRRLIHDSLALTLTLGAVLCFQATREHASDTDLGREARLGVVACLTLFVTTKANSFFIIAMLFAFWLAMSVRRWWRSQPKTRGTATSNSLQAAPGNFGAWLGRNLPLVVLILVGLTSYFAIREPADLDSAHKYGQAASDIGKLMLLTYSTHVFTRICFVLMLALWGWLVAAPRDGGDREVMNVDPEPPGTGTARRNARERGEPALSSNEAVSATRRSASLRTYLLCAYLALFIFAFFFGHGYLWWKAPVNLVRTPATWFTSYQASTSEIRQVARQGVPLGWQFLRQQLSAHPASPQLAWSQDAATWQAAKDWGEVVDAMPRMITYWAGQQAAPRLPGRDDYYIVLMTLYELPIVIAALCGVVCASRERTPFTDLLIWWAITSFTLYSLANEKVPWLLSHIMLPFILLAGWWLARLHFERQTGRWAFTGCCVLGAIFLLRGVSATNFERAADNREPMFYAQTADAYHNALMTDLQQTQNAPGNIWVHNDKQWPAVWYLRPGAPYMGSSLMTYSASPGNEPHRMLISTVEEWDKQKARFKDWHSARMGYFIWPRASWPAVRPDRFARWWLWRDAIPADEVTMSYDKWQKSIYIPPGEWSGVDVVMVTPP